VPTHPKYFPQYGFVIGGLDNDGEDFTIPRCYELESFSGFRLKLHGEGIIISGKPIIAYYLFEKNYKKIVWM